MIARPGRWTSAILREKDNFESGMKLDSMEGMEGPAFKEMVRQKGKPKIDPRESMYGV